MNFFVPYVRKAVLSSVITAAGMSQNGAKNMALQGLGAEQILNFFYEGCEICSGQ